MTDEELERLRREGDQPEPLFDVRHCKNAKCGKPIEQRVGEPRAHFLARVTCNLSCAAATATAQRPAASRTCQNPACGREFGRRLNETWTKYENRRFCGQPCHLATRQAAAEARREEKKQARLATRKAAPKPAVVKPRKRTEPDIDLWKLAEEWAHFSGCGWSLSKFAREMKVPVGSLVKAAERKPNMGASILAAWARECERKAS